MKKTNKKIVLIVLVALLLIAFIVTGYVIIRRKQAERSGSADSTGSATGAAGTSSSAAASTLQYGSRGDEVKRLQQFLNAQLVMLVWRGLPTYNGKEISKLDEDGIFGARTLAVVKWYFNSTSVRTNQF